MFKCDCNQVDHDPDCLRTLYETLQESPKFRIIEEIVDLDHRLQNHYVVDADNIPAHIYQGHKILVAERKRLEKEEDSKRE